jgi:flagellar biosynthesis protein FlhF
MGDTTKNDIINRGGVVALVGPTGVGKTTTIAKLAAGFAQVHGANQVALISTDTFRIAGFEQLETYGKIIGCQVVLAKNSEALNTFIDQFTHKKLILIDTAGMGQRDVRLAEQLTALVANSRVRIRNYLVLAANSQQRVMQENVDPFKKIPLSGCIYTKIDESFSIAQIITTSIQNGLSIGYLTDGQRVPEDIRVANAEKLVSLADKMASKLVNRHVGSHMNSLLPMPMVLGAVL